MEMLKRTLVIDHEGTVDVLEGGVGGEDSVVRLDDRVGHLGRRVDGYLHRFVSFSFSSCAKSAREVVT